ncbi:uncharacterized protein [Diadema setosum]|uniref:uncharacterized protein n=1 Tax=Diadema setosum TaxID=31175 RepID=UPI003B3B1B4C
MNLTTFYLAILAAILAVAAGRNLDLGLPVVDLDADEFPQIEEQKLDHQSMRDLVSERLWAIIRRLKLNQPVDLNEELATLDEGAEKLLSNDDFTKRGRRPTRKICINDIWKGRGGGLRCN